MKSESQTQSGAEKRPEPKLSQESPPGRSWYSASGLRHRKTTAPPIAEHPKGEAWHNWSAEEVLAHLGSSAPGRVSNLMRPMAIPSARPKTSELGIVMGGMHFAAGIPVRNLCTSLQNGFPDAPLGRRPALAHRGMVFEPLFRWSKRHCVRALRSPKTAGALPPCADRRHLSHSFPCRKEVLQPIIISQDPVDHSPGRAHDLAGQQHDDVQKTPKLHFD